MAAHQPPPSLGFSRQEHWSGLPLPSPMSKSESEIAQLCPTLSDPRDRSLPGSSVHGILQARVLEWGAIAFSDLKYLRQCKCYVNTMLSKYNVNDMQIAARIQVLLLGTFWNSHPHPTPRGLVESLDAEPKDVQGRLYLN